MGDLNVRNMVLFWMAENSLNFVMEVFGAKSTQTENQTMKMARRFGGLWRQQEEADLWIELSWGIRVEISYVC